jgi:hypothetical protein
MQVRRLSAPTWSGLYNKLHPVLRQLKDARFSQLGPLIDDKTPVQPYTCW